MARRLNPFLLRLSRWPRRIAALVCLLLAAASTLAPASGTTSAAPKRAGNPIVTALSPGQLALPVTVSSGRAASFVRTGDRVGFLTAPDATARASPTLVADGLRVLAVSQSADVMSGDSPVVVVAAGRADAVRLAAAASGVLLVVVDKSPRVSDQISVTRGYGSHPGENAVLKGFKEFIMRGNVVDLAVAVVIGAAFKTVIDAFVANIITPLIAAIGGQPDFSTLSFTINKSHFLYGNFINTVISFVIIAAAIYFLVVVPLNALAERRAARLAAGQPVEEPAAKGEDVVVLEQIRDLLQSQQGGGSAVSTGKPTPGV